VKLKAFVHGGVTIEHPRLGLIVLLANTDPEGIDTPADIGPVWCAFSGKKSALEDAIGSHACSLEANMRVTNGIPLGSPLPLPLPP
jgi:hypothetical protein